MQSNWTVQNIYNLYRPDQEKTCLVISPKHLLVQRFEKNIWRIIIYGFYLIKTLFHLHNRVIVYIKQSDWAIQSTNNSAPIESREAELSALAVTPTGAKDSQKYLWRIIFYTFYPEKTLFHSHNRIFAYIR